MFTRIRNMHPITGIVIGVVATLVLSGTAMAVTDTSFTYSTARAGYFTIHPMDLAPHNEEGDYQITFASAQLTSAASFSCFSTGVHVPDRAKITTVETFYRSGTGDGYATLTRNELFNGAVVSLTQSNLPITGNARSSVKAIVPVDRRTVFNHVFSFGYGICLAAYSPTDANTFEGARITYTYTSAGD